MVQRIDLDGEVFRMLKENNLMIIGTQHSITNQNRRNEEWMLRKNLDVPIEWSNETIKIQPYERGFPVLTPIEPIKDEEHPGGVFRFPKKWEMRTQQIEQLIEKQGTDALAWYRPFHMDPQENWGITILDQGIWYLARKLATEIYGERDDYTADQISNCRDIAKDFLYHHEMFHFKVELAATMMEINNITMPIYAHYWGPNGSRQWFGSPSETLRGNAPLEEALANSYAREKVISEFSNPMKDKVRIAINEFMKSQPEGYKHGIRIKGKNKKWVEGVSELINKLLNDDGDGFSSERILASHVLFDGVYGKEDWIEEYYEEIVPCRILDTGFAEGRFAKSSTNLYLGDFCMSKTCRGEYRKARPHSVQADLQKAIYEWEHDEFASTLGKRRPRTGFKLKGKWNKNRGVSEVYLKGDGVHWRFYHEKFDNGERIILRMHKKTVGVQEAIIKTISSKNGIQHWKVGPHNKNCFVP